MRRNSPATATRLHTALVRAILHFAFCISSANVFIFRNYVNRFLVCVRCVRRWQCWSGLICLVALVNMRAYRILENKTACSQCEIRYHYHEEVCVRECWVCVWRTSLRAKYEIKVKKRNVWQRRFAFIVGNCDFVLETSASAAPSFLNAIKRAAELLALRLQLGVGVLHLSQKQILN